MAMTETELLGEASFAWDDGRKSEALHLMKFAVKNDPSLLAARRALAERYREMGHPDQAGRWGIAFDGWTTDIERDRLGRLLGSSGIAKRDTVQFLGLPDEEIPTDLESVFSDLAKKYRRNLEIPAVIGASTFGAWILFLVTFVLGIGITFVTVLIDAADPQVARTLTLVWLAMLAFAYGFSAACAFSLRAFVWAAVWLAGAIALFMLVVRFNASGWIYT